MFDSLRPTLLGKIVYYLLPIRKGVVFSNMRLVFGRKLSEAEIKNLAQCFYSHLVKLVFENLALLWMSDEAVKRSVEVRGFHIARREGSKGKGMICLTCHLGNWEFGPIGAILHHPEYRDRFFFLRKLLVNKFIERIAFGRFYKAGYNIIPKGNTLSEVMGALEKNHVVPSSLRRLVVGMTGAPLAAAMRARLL